MQGGRLGPAFTRRSPGGRRRLLTAALGVALVAVAIPALRPAASRALRAAPALPGALLSGRPVTLASLRGRPAIVNFWASWCDPCNREAAALERVARIAPHGAAVVGVDVNDARTSAERFVHRYAITYPNLSDDGEVTSSSYGLIGLPTTVVLDRRGRIVETLRGRQTIATLTAAVSAASG